MAPQKAVITLGKGQLGLMLGKASKRLGIPFTALSIPEAYTWVDTEPDPSRFLVTFEQEHVEESLLHALEAKGIEAFPSWKSFEVLRSKLSQKNFLAKHGIATSPFLEATPWSAKAEQFVLSKAVLKAGRGGYDGKGVWVVDDKGNTKQGPAKEVASHICDPYLEQMVPFDYELAAVVCRSKNGQLAHYPAVKSLQSDGICFQVEYSHEFSGRPLAKQANQIAGQIAQALDYVGVLAVEFFVLGDQLLVNEIAPRVHNSGHFTIDVCAGSQFENHLRAGLNLPLISTEPTHPAALMTNLLWPKEETDFASLFTKLTCGSEWPENAKLHWYGKSEARPRRKMGHFTIYGQSLAQCHQQADQILASRWSQG